MMLQPSNIARVFQPQSFMIHPPTRPVAGSHGRRGAMLRTILEA